MAARGPDWIKWRHAKARLILLADLEPDGVLWGRDAMSAEDAWGFYSGLPEFQAVPFAQFSHQLREHRMQTRRQRGLSERDLHAFRHDLELHRTPYDEAGRLVWAVHPAKDLLRQDVKDGLHTIMSPSNLRLTRPEYQEFDKKRFKEHIYQEVRRNKFINHLENKRAEKARKEGSVRTQEAFDRDTRRV